MTSTPARARPLVVVALLAVGLLACALVAAVAFPEGVRLRRFADLVYVVGVVGAGGYAVRAASRRHDEWRGFALLLGVGLALSGLGDLVWTVDSWGRTVPGASPADVFYLAGLGAMSLSLLAAVTARWAQVDTDAVIDVVTIGVVAVMLMWHSALAGLASSVTDDPLGRAIVIAYPAFDAVLIGLAVRLFWAGTLRAWLGPGFVVGLACWLASDIGYLYDLIGPDDEVWTSVGWLAGSILMARALVPTDRGPAPPRRSAGSLGRVLVAILPLAVPTLLLALDSGSGDDHLVVELGGAVVLVVLALVRTLRLLRSEAAARRELVQARDDALEASRAKSAFLSTMSHEIRTPLNGVLGLTTLLRGTQLDPHQRRYADEAARAGHTLLAIINDVLDFSKCEAGRLQIEELDLDVREVLADVVGLARSHGSTRSTGPAVEVRVVVDPALPACLRGDPHRLRQVLLNLAANAFKFTARGTVRLEARVVARRDGEADVRFSVGDTGIGIAPDDLARMFDPFVQADSSTTREYGGTGLGLTISRQLVEAMGGRLEATSELGTGSEFSFVLPLRLAPEPAAREPEPPAAAGPHVPGAPGLVVRRALVVALDEIDQIVAEGIATHLGFEVGLACDVDAALAVLAAGDTALVLVDARVDGAQALVRERAGVPSIAVADEPAVCVRARALGFDVVVSSPLEVLAVREAVDEVLLGAASAG
jgi:signal transduction histidine kinase